MKRFWLWLMLLFPCVALGQSGVSEYDLFKEKHVSKFAKYQNAADDNFRAYREKVNAEYSDFMRRKWDEYQSKPAEPVPDRDEPIKPVVKPDSAISLTTPVPVVVPEVTVEPLPDVPDIIAPTPADEPEPVPMIDLKPAAFEFIYYGTRCSVVLEDSHRFTLNGIDENSVADAWGVLSGEIYDRVLQDCLRYKADLKLCDWGYVKFLEKMTEAFFSQSRKNEARLMQIYFLVQSGYKVRIARIEKELVLLLPSVYDIYEYSYLKMNDCKYYIIGSKASSGRKFCVFDREFPNEKYLSLNVAESPLLDVRAGEKRVLQTKKCPGISVEFNVNLNLIDFYNDYPLNSNWDNYAQTPISNMVKGPLYAELKNAIKGMNELQAANKILRFVQYSLDYQVDDEQFGEERPLFADETLYYPYCDCEDRSILFSRLVYDLLGLEAVLVEYTHHLATAVKFNEAVPGYYISVNGENYTIADPTYIGAKVGDVMTDYRGVSPKAIRLNF